MIMPHYCVVVLVLDALVVDFYLGLSGTPIFVQKRMHNQPPPAISLTYSFAQKIRH
jgi:hypothetical protein